MTATESHKVTESSGENGAHRQLKRLGDVKVGGIRRLQVEGYRKHKYIDVIDDVFGKKGDGPPYYDRESAEDWGPARAMTCYQKEFNA